MTDRESAQVQVAETPDPTWDGAGEGWGSPSPPLCTCTRSIAGSDGVLETSYALELGNSSTTLPGNRTRQCPRVGRRAEAASEPKARVSCPGQGAGLPGEGGRTARLSRWLQGQRRGLCP